MSSDKDEPEAAPILAPDEASAPLPDEQTQEGQETQETKETQAAPKEDNPLPPGFDPSSIITQVPEPAVPSQVHHHPHKLRRGTGTTTAGSSIAGSSINKVAPLQSAGESQKKDEPTKKQQQQQQQQKKAEKDSFFGQLFCCMCCTSEQVEPPKKNEASTVVTSTSKVDAPLEMTTEVVKKKESNVSIVAESVLEEPVPDDQQVPSKDHSPIPSSSEDGSVEHLLPRILPENVGKKCLVLDLDETLVHSSFKPVANADMIIPIDIEGTYHNVYVLKRPHVDSFLENLGKEFEVVIFTASMSNYANPVLDLLDTHKVIQHRLFREHCVYYNGAYVKDLTMLGRPIEDCIIVDNSAFSYAFQPENAVPCQSWYNDLEDDELLELQPFLMGLKTIPDVRTVLGAAGDSADDAYENIV